MAMGSQASTGSSAGAPAEVMTVGPDVVMHSLRAGWQDFKARPTATLFLIAVYPFIGLLLYRFAFDEALLPLLFPLASGFALIGPLAAAGLYEISRQQERRAAAAPDPGASGEPAAVPVPPEMESRLAPLIAVGLLLLVIYAAWIGAAQLIYEMTLGEWRPEGIGDLLARAFTTAEGWALILVGCGVGFLFALVVLAVGAISLPAIVDRGMGPAEAVALSVRAFVANTATMLRWGFIIALGLALGSLPAFLGLLVVLPIFGHATWHLYRRLVRYPG